MLVVRYKSQYLLLTIDIMRQKGVSAMSKCIFCGSSGPTGAHCPKSPSGGHVKITKGKCSYCGSAGPMGSHCPKSPTGAHVRSEPGKCSYCGSAGPVGSHCSKSPTGGHVRGVSQ